MKRLLYPIRRWLLRQRIEEIQRLMYEDQRAVDIWPTATRPMYLREIARLKSSLDRLNGRGDRVNWSLTPKGK